MRAASLALATLVGTAIVGAAFVGGCVLFTGSTNGYTLVEGGADGATCMSAADCFEAGVCCLAVSSQTMSAAGSCQSSCGTSDLQICKASSECGDAGSCATVTCKGVTLPIQACGTIKGCK